MKGSIFKPLGVFIVGVCVLSGIIMITKGIKIPTVSLWKNQSAKEKNVFKEIKAKNGKLLISYSDLNAFFSECCGSIVSNVRSSKNGDSVKMIGKATFPFPADFEGNVVFYTEANQVKIHLTALKLGKIETPQILEGKLSTLIQKELDEKINKKYQIKNVKIKEEGIEIETR